MKHGVTNNFAEVITCEGKTVRMMVEGIQNFSCPLKTIKRIDISFNGTKYPVRFQEIFQRQVCIGFDVKGTRIDFVRWVSIAVE